jgi:hypothetical protein
MSETREFPTAVIASITTGIMLCQFGDMHEAAEFVMGHPIWTHHFADKTLSDEMRKTVLAQVPAMPTKIDGVTPDNYLQKLAEIEAVVGATVKLKRGGGLTALLPTDGIPDRLKDKTITIEV